MFAVAVPMVAVGALLNAGTLLVLGGLLTLAAAARWSVVADIGEWSSDKLAVNIPVPLVVAGPAAVVAIVLAARAVALVEGLLLLLVRPIG